MPLPPRERIERTLMRHEAYRALRALIASGQLEPGERLRDADLAVWLGVSRTPVREALTRLADEGVVEMAPNRFTRVRPLSAADAEQGYPLVAALHALATKGAVAGPNEAAVVAELGEATERHEWAALRDDVADALEADEDFHMAIARAADNALLLAELERLSPRLRQLEVLSGASAAAADQVDAHRRVIELLAAGSGEAAGAAASELVGEEWRSRGRAVIEALRRSGAAAG